MLATCVCVCLNICEKPDARIASVCVCVCVCIYICVCVCVCVGKHVCVCVCVHVCARMHALFYVRMVVVQHQVTCLIIPLLATVAMNNTYLYPCL